MKAPHEHYNEIERLKELDSFSVLDTLPESDYDNLTAIAAEICGTKISLVSLIDNKRQWFKSHHGLDATETPREFAFCAHAINDQDNIFIIEDARKDERFHDNPLVTGDPHVIFYAGVPLVSDNGLPLGTLCVIDNEPKFLNEAQIETLTALSHQVMNILNLRKNKLILEKTLEHLEERNQELESFASVVAHDLKSPLIGISNMAEILSKNYGSLIDEKGNNMLNIIKKSSNKLSRFIDGLLAYSKSKYVLKEKKSQIVIANLENELNCLFTNHNLTLTIKSSLKEIVTNRAALDQILINLVSNAIKYNDKEKIDVEIGISSSKSYYKFYVKDNGPGITLKNRKKIFNIFETTANKDRFGKKGNGIGLATVKKMVENSGGTIKIESETGKGSNFIFTLEK